MNRMNFKEGNLYHVFNQGNNRQLIFYKRDNYEFFLEKISEFVTPYADILAYCLMPNHFHLMLCVNHTHNIVIDDPSTLRDIKDDSINHEFLHNSKARSLNHSIGIMLRSYTRAINNQEYRTGSLFRQSTKEVCITGSKKVLENWYKRMGIKNCNRLVDEMHHNVCFNYILYNPVKAGLVHRPEEWEFSSCQEYLGMSDLKITNKERVKELGLWMSSGFRE